MNYYLTEEEINGRVDLFFDTIESISEEYFPEMINENFEYISEDMAGIFEDIIDYFIQVVDINNPEMNEELSETLAELFLTETVGDVIAKFSKHSRKEGEANRAAKEYKRVAKEAGDRYKKEFGNVSSSKEPYGMWYANKKSKEASRLEKDATEQARYHMGKRAELAAKIDRKVGEFTAHPVVSVGRGVVKGVGAVAKVAGKLAVKGGKAAVKVLSRGIKSALGVNLKQRHRYFQDRKYERRLPRLRTVRSSAPLIKKTN